MENFRPQVGLITQDCYLHGCGDLINIGNPGKIVYVADKYFVLEDLESGKAFIVPEENYWAFQ